MSVFIDLLCTQVMFTFILKVNKQSDKHRYHMRSYFKHSLVQVLIEFSAR